MRIWTEKELRDEGYDIYNGFIKYADLSMADHGCMTLRLGISCASFYIDVGGYSLGHGYVGAENFSGSQLGMEYIMRVMDTVGRENFNKLEGTHVRLALKNRNDSERVIGNIIEEKWFDAKSFFEDATFAKTHERYLTLPEI